MSDRRAEADRPSAALLWRAELDRQFLADLGVRDRTAIWRVGAASVGQRADHDMPFGG